MDNKEYKVLARKYRPQKFEDLIGQEILVSILSNSIVAKRIAHSYVLTGVRGVGKTTTARLIAMSLNCNERQKNNPEPCGECDSCLSIKKDSNIDVIEMDAASKTGVDDVREIIDNIKYKPVNNSYKIFIIDEVHMLSTNAFNALLKTLEEPPNHVKFIFATTEVKKIPITILSRCQRFDLLRIEREALTNHLFKISKLENIDIDKEAMGLIVRAADGSVRDGLSLLDQAMSNQNNKIDTKTINSMLGLADRNKIFDLLEFIFQGNATNALNVYKDLYNSGADIVMIFDEMLNSVHFITQIKIYPDLVKNIYIPEIERTRGLEISKKINMNSLGLIWQVLFKGYQELQEGFHLFQHGEMIILRLIYIHDGPSPEELLSKIENKKNNDTDKAVIEKDATTSIKNNSTKSIELDNEKLSKNLPETSDKSIINISSYREFVDLFYIKKEGMIHSNLYNKVKLISFKEGEVILNTDSIIDKHFNRTVGKNISKWTGRIWQIHSSNSNIGKSLFEEDLLKQQEEIKEMQNNSEVRQILENFPGTTIHSISDINEINDENKIENINKNKKEF